MKENVIVKELMRSERIYGILIGILITFLTMSGVIILILLNYELCAE